MLILHALYISELVAGKHRVNSDMVFKLSSFFASNFRISCIISFKDPVEVWTMKRLKTRLGKSLKNRLYKVLHWEEDAAVDN